MADGHFLGMRMSRRDVLRCGAMAAAALTVGGLVGCGDGGGPWYKDVGQAPETGETPAEETVVPP